MAAARAGNGPLAKELDDLCIGAGGAVIQVGVTGFEPAASSSRTKRSTKLSYTPHTNCCGRAQSARGHSTWDGEGGQPVRGEGAGRALRSPHRRPSCPVPQTAVQPARMTDAMRRGGAEPVTVRFDRVSRLFSAVAGVAGIDFKVAPRECVALMGASGCGKTTLLRIAAGLEAPTGGRMSFERDGKEVPRTEVEIGVCFQEPRLLPWRNALRNVALPLEIRGVPKRDARLRAYDALDLVGLLGSAKTMPAKLSGGMRMRVGLARALVAQPKVLLLDEPCSALDIVTRVEIEDHITHVREAMHMTIVLVTHAIEEAAFLADRVAILAGSPAGVIETLEITHGSRASAVRDSQEFSVTLSRLMQSLHAAARRGL